MCVCVSAMTHRSSPQRVPTLATVMSVAAFRTAVVGDKVIAKDKKGLWCAGKIIDEDGEGDERRLKVHFDGWK